MTQTLQNTDFNHVLNLSDRVLEWKIAERVATDIQKQLTARRVWYKLLNEMKLECLKKGIDYELFALESFFDEPKALTLQENGSVQTGNLTCPVCGVELQKGMKYCSREHRIEFHNSNRKKK